MAEERNKDLSDQPSLWFLNRGLFSDHFLKARLPQWKEWQQSDKELATFHKQLLSLYESKKSVLPFLNEPQTEREFVQPGELGRPANTSYASVLMLIHS